MTKHFLADRTVSVSSTMQRLKNTDCNQATKTSIRISSPKSDSSVRVIPLSDYLFDLCSQWSEMHPEAYVLTGKLDKFIEPRTLQYRLAKYTKDCNLEGVHYHVLRHPYVKYTTKIFSLRLMDFQVQAYPDARRKTRGACQLHRGGQSQSPVRPLCNRKRFSCLPPQ